VDDDQDGLLTRRRLLATGAVAAASYTLLGSSASAKASTAGGQGAKAVARFSRRGYGRSRFAPHVGTPVTLRPRGGAAVRGTLAGIEDVPWVKSLAGDEDVYTLCFRTAAATPLAEGVAAIRHTDFGAIELYLTPTGAFGAGQDYLAVVNRRVPRSARRAAGR